MIRRILAAAILIFILLRTGTEARAQGDPVSEVIQRVNALRISYGLPPYEVDSALMSAAQAQASWSAANNHIGHDGPGGSTPNERALAAGYGGGVYAFAIENAAHGTIEYNTPELVVTMWQSDWAHLNAMISPDYEHIGVGYAEENGDSWYVLMAGYVGSKGTGVASGSAEAPVGENPPSASFVLSTPDASGGVMHEVTEGQSAWMIASYYGIDLASLLTQNDLTTDSILHPGDFLIIYPPATPTITPTIELTEIATLTPAPVQVTGSTPVPTSQPKPDERASRTAIVVLSVLGTLLIAITVMMIRLRHR